MATSKKAIWKAPSPHTKAKHRILKQYLQAWFPILGTKNKRAVYIDGFCGPGRYENGDLGSPIIALNAAINCPIEIRANLVFRFIDNDNEITTKLESELDKIRRPSNFNVKVLCADFQEVIEKFLDHYEGKGRKVPPTFLFIDPFGIKGVPFSLVDRLLKLPKCEVLINFMVEALNRCLSSPDRNTIQHALDFLGIEDTSCIAVNSKSRKKDLRFFYGRRLRESAEFVRHFEMKNIRHRTIYYLFFATNHRRGHLKMKEAMWKVDPGGDFVYSDATDPDQQTLFQDECIVPNLSRILENRYRGKGIITCKDIIIFVEDKTAFLKQHMRKVFKELEPLEKIKVEKIKTDGKKRRAGSYPPQVLLTFM